MPRYQASRPDRVRQSKLRFVLFILLSLSLACALPGLSKKTPAAQPTPLSAVTAPPAVPTPTAQPLPPALVESDPPPGSEIPLASAITFYFNQPMDHSTVEGALSGQPALSGRFTWADDSTLTFTPDSPFLPETEVEIMVGDSARSKKGLGLMNPLTLNYRTSGYLKLTQVLPDPGAREVAPSSAIVAAFNRPVVALGADPAGLPAGFSLRATSGMVPQGHGEWINTSTYIFYPEPPLAGGMEYSASINRQLTGVEGSPLASETASSKSPYEWSFTTATPRLVSIDVDGQPIDNASPVGLEPKIVLTFNQPMDTPSIEENFVLKDGSSRAVPGNITWNEDLTELTYSPVGLLKRDSAYAVSLGADARSGGGTTLGVGTEVGFFTASDLSVIASEPSEGGVMEVYSSLTLLFAAHLPWEGLDKYFSLEPKVPNTSYYLDTDRRTLWISGSYEPSTDYTLTVSPDLTDLWGGSLGEPFTLKFKTGPLNPNLIVQQMSDIVFLTPQDDGLPVQVTNLSSIPYSFGSVPLLDFMRMFAPGGYEMRQSYLPEDLRSSTQALDILPDRNQTVDLKLSPEDTPLTPGLNYLKFNFPPEKIFTSPTLLVTSNVQLTFKIGATDALVWAVDLRTNAPVANTPVALYDENGSPLALGQTDDQGIFYTSIPTLTDPYRMTYAVVGQPGDETFGFALSTLNQGVGPWDFGVPVDYTPPGLKYYIYTDRPIYRPGQTVYFKAILRLANNGRYSLPDAESLPNNRASLKLFNDIGEEISTFELPLSAFGSVHGEYRLPPDARPGFYRVGNDPYYVNFQVADYRKPEINLTVTIEGEQALAGQNLAAQVNARYFFDAPAGDIPVHWALYARPASFNLTGYQVGPDEMQWYYTNPEAFLAPLGELVSEGEERTGPDGLLDLLVATKVGRSRQQYTLEVTATDESGMPVSARSQILVNPAPYYVGLRSDAWVGQAGAEMGFDVKVVDWEGKSGGERQLRAIFQKVEWVPGESTILGPYGEPTYVPKYTPVGSSSLTTAADGLARVSFIPPEPGTYQLSVGEENAGTAGGALTQLQLWVGGPGQAIWPNFPYQQLHLTPDRDSYRPGDTAQVFFPNPFGAGAMALVSVERGRVIRHQVISIDDSGMNLSLPLSEEDAPNVYLTVTLLGKGSQGQPDFRQGYVNLPVEPLSQRLDVSLVTNPERAGPGDQVTFKVRVTDSGGRPVQGEFSLAMVDLAALALADPNAPGILSAFYGTQPLGVRTGLDLAAYARREISVAEGRGGGGGEGVAPVVRERFPDTAYWNAEIITDENGEATLELSLPDSLTTWQVDVRGLTADTRVGEAEAQVITSKELQVRPAMPRFLVAGDHVPLAMVVQNITGADLQADVSLAVNGIVLDEGQGDDTRASRLVSVPAGGRVRVEWWGTVQDVEYAEVVFSAEAGDLQDTVRLSGGPGSTVPGVPVLGYSALQTFATTGNLPEGGQKLELVSLPRGREETSPRSQGNLRLVLTPSLVSTMLEALGALEAFPYESTEQLLSRYLANLETYRALGSLGIDSTEIQAHLQEALADGLERLLTRQNQDGGWGWWPGVQSASDMYLTAYVLLGLTRARDAGTIVSPVAIQRAVDYLVAGLVAPQMSSEGWQLDRLAFEHYVLEEAGMGDSGGASALYSVRDQLSPWAQAFLALTLDKLASADFDQSGNVQTLLSDLQASAIRSATGAHWEDGPANWRNMSSPIFTTAVVVYTVALLDPASSLLPEATRFLMSHRQVSGGWSSSYETAWTILAGLEFIKGTGDVGVAGGDFAFRAALNGTQIADGRGVAGGVATPLTVQVPASELYPDQPNALVIQRDEGPGNLYYSAYLNVRYPVEAAQPLNRGMTISRSYYPLQDTRFLDDRSAIQEAKVGEMVTVRLTLVLPNDGYYLLVEDYIPAGAEILDTSLKTSQQGLATEPGGPIELNYDPNDPFREGWGWWYFHPPQIYADHIAWAVDYLPAGSYVLTYTLVPLYSGEYRVLPARAWQFYFPEVQGASAGTVFELKPK